MENTLFYKYIITRAEKSRKNNSINLSKIILFFIINI